MCDGIVRNPAARYSWGSLSVRFFTPLFNFDGLSGPFALMLAAEEGCKVRAIYRPHITRSSGVIQVAIWVPIRKKKTTFEMWIIDICYSPPPARLSYAIDNGISRGKWLWHKLFLETLVTDIAAELDRVDGYFPNCSSLCVLHSFVGNAA